MLDIIYVRKYLAGNQKGFDVDLGHVADPTQCYLGTWDRHSSARHSCEFCADGDPLAAASAAMSDSLVVADASQALVLADAAQEQALVLVDESSDTKRKAKWTRGGPSKKGRRWGLLEDKPFKPLSYVELPIGLAESEVDQFLREQRLEDLNRKIQARDWYMLKNVEGYLPPEGWKPQRLVKKSSAISAQKVPQDPELFSRVSSAMMSQARRGVARLGAAAALSAAMGNRNLNIGEAAPTRGLCQSSDVSYYGSYLDDRFGGGIGRRVGIDESGKVPLQGTGVARVATFTETHESLRKWATKENWQQATEIHKGAYFTRYTNEIQEAVLEHVRAYYERTEYEAKEPVSMALYRFEDQKEFEERINTMRVRQLPAVVHGVFDEKNERCIVDFANKRLGGGWLSYGCVQEEIMFIERPDFGAMCARSLLEMPDPRKEPNASPFSMEANEVWILRGAPRYAELGWYGRAPKDALQKVKLLNPEDDQMTSPTVIAMDAIKASFEIYRKEHLEMMLIKAYTGFAAAKDDAHCQVIATGSWGCGAFYNGEPVMFAIQSLAANAAGVALTYHSLGDGRRLAPAFELLEEALVKKLRIKEALDLLVDRCANDPAFRTKFKPRTARSNM
eukprot:Skav209967  [mRNA]  locus=scaffold4929:19121:24758:- [translate_table: standard]